MKFSDVRKRLGEAHASNPNFDFLIDEAKFILRGPVNPYFAYDDWIEVESFNHIITLNYFAYDDWIEVGSFTHIITLN